METKPLTKMQTAAAELNAAESAHAAMFRYEGGQWVALADAATIAAALVHVEAAARKLARTR